MKTLITFFSLFLIYSNVTIGQVTCDRMADSLQLVAFHDSTDGPNWFTPWDLTLPMDYWYGVDLNIDGCVVEIDGYWTSDLDGTLPTLDLPFLEVLDVSLNSNLEGSIPDFQLPNLKELNLGACDFDGLVPNFSNMANLEYLNLSSNFFIDFQALTHLPNLVYLSLHDCYSQLSSYDSLPSLEYAYIAQNSTSLIPTFASSTQMKVIRASGTYYEQPVPDYSHMPDLHHLDISYSYGGSGFDTKSFANPAGFPSLTYLRVNNGAFTFDDLLPFANLDTFIYAPQAKIEWYPSSIDAFEGNMVELHVPIDSSVTSSVYQWSKDGQVVATTTSNSYWIASAAKSDSGEYVTTITNSTLPDLTLETRPFTLHVYDLLTNFMIQPDAQQNIQAGTQIPAISMSYSPNQIQGTNVFYVMTDTLGNVLKVGNGSLIDISSSTLGSFRGYGVLHYQGAGPQIGDNIFAMDDSLLRFKVSENFMPIQVSSATSLENAIDTGLQLMPNPTSDILRLFIPESMPVPPTGWTLEIMTIEGQLIHQESERFSSSIELDVADYPTGVYLLRLRNQAQQWSMRWVKE